MQSNWKLPSKELEEEIMHPIEHHSRPHPTQLISWPGEPPPKGSIIVLHPGLALGSKQLITVSFPELFQKWQALTFSLECRLIC